MSNETILSIDPGKLGGFALWLPTGISVQAMPDTEGDIIDYLKHCTLVAEGSNRIAIMEEQRGFTPQGEKGFKMAGANMFTFGQGYGHLKGGLQMAGWRLELVNPKTWQSGLSLGSAKRHPSKTAWKNHCKQRAQALYPGIKLTLQTCDAILIMEWYLKQRRVPVQQEMLA